MDFYGAGKIMESMGDVERSLQFFRRALDGNLTDEVSLEAKKRLSTYFKRNGEWEKAVPIWEEVAAAKMVTPAQLHSLRELAMYFEHRLKNYREAKRIAEEGYVQASGFSSYFERDFDYRLERLRRKIKQQEEKT